MESTTHAATASSCLRVDPMVAAPYAAALVSRHYKLFASSTKPSSSMIFGNASRSSAPM